MAQKTLPKPPSKEYWDDLEWLNKHYSELRNQYSDKWIAVVNQEVVSSGTNLVKCSLLLLLASMDLFVRVKMSYLYILANSPALCRIIFKYLLLYLLKRSLL